MKPGAAPEPTLNGETRVYGVLGYPVAHSLSPAMHNAAFRAARLNAIYVPFPVAPERLAEGVRGLCAAGVSGFNVTVPHKSAVLALLDDVLPEARAVGAVNTVRRQAERLVGTNTDGVGFLLSLERDLGFRPADKHVLLLGAGGAARAIAFALLGVGVASLIVANRTLERAKALVAECRTRYPDVKVLAARLDEVAEAAPHLLVNATSLGMGDGRSPLALKPVGVREAVLDIVYHPPETPLLAEARTLSLRGANGLGMLLYQGAAAWQFWTDREAPVDVMRTALAEVLALRGE